jgi:hypothetical protein
MTDERAAEMLQELRTHFKEPVFPMSHFCDSMRSWFECIVQNNTNQELIVDPKHPEYQHGHEYHGLLRRLEIDITKSNLLWRLLYGGQQVRKTKCPEHKGHWSGCAPEPCEHGCSNGLDITGWIPEPEDVDRPKDSALLYMVGVPVDPEEK